MIDGLGPVISLWVIFNAFALQAALVTIFVATFGILRLQAVAGKHACRQAALAFFS